MAKKKKKKAQEHALDTETGYHLGSNGGDGGCLTSHESEYKDGNACSHRYQAYQHALEYSHWYNFPAYRLLEQSPALNPSERPKGNSWDLGGSRVWTTGTIPNFRLYASVPYAHNGHHLIPYSVLNGALFDAAKNDMRIFYLVRASLLEANYNLNDKENMVILPMRKVIADALGLPRHISQIDAEPGVKPEQCDHSIYSTNVRDRVEPIIADFASEIDMKQHDVDAPAFAKDRLVGISQSLFMQLRAWGAIAKGQAVNAIPAALFS